MGPWAVAWTAVAVADGRQQIITGNINLIPIPRTIVDNCTQTGPLSDGRRRSHLGPLAYNGFGSLVHTPDAVTGQRAIQVGDATQLPVGLTNDERGFPAAHG